MFNEASVMCAAFVATWLVELPRKIEIDVVVNCGYNTVRYNKYSIKCNVKLHNNKYIKL